MILKALYDYYHRCDDLAPSGMEYKEIAFLIVIDREGHFVRLEDRRIDAKASQKFLVMKGVRSGINPKPYLFWDNVEYVCNYTKYHPELNEKEVSDEGKQAEREDAIKKAALKHEALILKFKDLSDKFSENRNFRAVSLFYQSGELAKIMDSPLWGAIAKKPTVNLSFLINGETKIVAEDECLTSLEPKDSFIDIGTEETSCLITGIHCKAVESSTPTPILGGQATARLVSFQVNSGYDSYGKTKGNNAPISKEAESCYTTALNKLLARDSRNKFTIASRTFVFWASSRSEASQAAEAGLFALLGYVSEEDDDPNRRIESVHQTFNSIYSGKYPSTSDDRFYFLGLAPNSARIAVVYWHEITLKDFAKQIMSHFDDMHIIDNRKEKKSYMGLHQIMSAVALKGKASDVQPNLPEAVIKSMIQGISYPYALMLSCIKRIRAEQSVTIARAAIIKAYLNRLSNNNKKLCSMVDKENVNLGYLCGRLFAALEYLQERSSNGNSTIRSRYMNAASATPAAVFPTLLNLSNHHEDKLNKGGQIFFEQVKREIIAKIPVQGFPTHLDLNDQGRFMVGYYHQRQEFYTTKEASENINIEQ